MKGKMKEEKVAVEEGNLYIQCPEKNIPLFKRNLKEVSE